MNVTKLLIWTVSVSTLNWKADTWPLTNWSVARAASGGSVPAGEGGALELMVAVIEWPGKSTAPPVAMKMLPLKLTACPKVTEKSSTPIRMSLNWRMLPSLIGAPGVVSVVFVADVFDGA